MSGGIDKLIILSPSIEDVFHELAHKQGLRQGKYGRVIDLRQTDHNLPVRLYCDGIYDGRHKIELVGVASLGQSRTLEIVRTVTGHLSGLRIYRIDFSLDLLGLSVWDLARICYVSRPQSFQIYRSRTGDTVYLQRSDAKTLMAYDKGRRLRAEHDPRAAMLDPGEALTRIEVQLKGSGVPFTKPRQIHRYAHIDLLAGLKLRRLISPSNHKKPLRSMAAAYLANQIEDIGLHAVLKRFPSSYRAYVEKLFLEEIEGNQVPDVRRLMRKGIEDWLNDRIRYPRLPGAKEGNEPD